MSGSRYSGIAVAAANRRALERQEQESNARASRSAGCLGRPLTPKENALLAQLRAQLVPPTRGSSESAAGGRRGTSSEEVKTYDVGPGEDEGDGGTCGTEGGKEPREGRAVPEEKRYMSKAARKKVKKRFEQQRNGAGASVAGRAAKGGHDDADKAKRVPSLGSGGGVKRRKKRKQTEEGPSVSGPPVEAGGNRKKKKPKVDEGAVTKKTSRREAAWPPMTKR